MSTQTEAAAVKDFEAHVPETSDDPDFQLTYGANDILKDEADYKAGLIKAVSWEEARAGANAVRCYSVSPIHSL